MLTRDTSLGIAALAVALALAQNVQGHEAEPSAARRNAHVVQQQHAFGVAGDARDVKRSIEILMRDEMRFIPDKLDVRQGETVRLTVTNTGTLPHELVIGTRKDLEAHAAMMMDTGMAHDEPYIAHVAPGKTGEIVWKFNRAGRFDFACLVAGHHAAGMVGTINVASR